MLRGRLGPSPSVASTLLPQHLHAHLVMAFTLDAPSNSYLSRLKSMCD